jgi:hypothetical protein
VTSLLFNNSQKENWDKNWHKKRSKTHEKIFIQHATIISFVDCSVQKLSST